MREAIKPAFDVAMELVPVGKVGKYKYPHGQPGGLKASLRIKVVKDKPYEIKGLVGSGKKKENGKWNAGNRAHFSEHGPQTGKRFWEHEPFAKPAEAQTKDLVEKRLGIGVETIIKEAIQ